MIFQSSIDRVRAGHGTPQDILDVCKAAEHGSVDAFIDSLITTLESHGIDATNWDGDEAPHVIVAGGIAVSVQNSKDEVLKRAIELFPGCGMETCPQIRRLLEGLMVGKESK